MILISLCTNSNLLMVFLIIKYTFSIICTIIPLLVILKAIIPMFKNIIKPEEFKQSLWSIIKSSIAGLIIFILPAIFSYAFTELLDYSDSNYSACFKNATLENIKKLQENEENERKKELSENKNKTEEELKKQKEELDKKNEILKQQREELEKKKQEENANNNNNNNSNNSQSKAYGDIFVGDSRTVGFKTQINLKNTDSVFATSGGAMKEFNNDISQAITKINSDSSHKYNIILNYGVNNLSQDWVTAYKNIINQINGKANILVVSVNPCNDSIAKYCRNSNIEKFNQKLKDSFSSNYKNVKYCDTYTPFKNTPNYLSMIETSEGIHYTKQGADFIYQKIQSCLSNF